MGVNGDGVPRRRVVCDEFISTSESVFFTMREVFCFLLYSGNVEVALGNQVLY